MNSRFPTSATYINYVNTSSGEFVYNPDLPSGVEMGNPIIFRQVQVIERRGVTVDMEPPITGTPRSSRSKRSSKKRRASRK